MRKDALADFEKAGRTDLANDYKAEIEILKRYLPEQMDSAKIKEVVQATAAELGIEGGKKNMGKLMGAVMKKVKGLADGNDVRKAIEEFLSEWLYLGAGDEPALFVMQERLPAIAPA